MKAKVKNLPALTLLVCNHPLSSLRKTDKSCLDPHQNGMQETPGKNNQGGIMQVMEEKVIAGHPDFIVSNS